MPLMNFLHDRENVRISTFRCLVVSHGIIRDSTEDCVENGLQKFGAERKHLFVNVDAYA